MNFYRNEVFCMKEITLHELINLLKNHHPAVHCEGRRNYSYWYADENTTVKCFLTNGCAVLYDAHTHYADPEKYRVYCHIHEVSDKCDPMEVCRKFKEMSDNAIKEYTKYSRDIELFHCGPLSDQLNEFYGFYKFTRMGEAFPSDPHISQLTRDNIDEIQAICDPAVLESDFSFGKCEAETFCNWDFDWHEKEGTQLLGYRDENGTLVGITSWVAVDELNLGFLLDLFVAPSGRRQGIGKALVREAISNLPNREWLYQAVCDNVPSIRLANTLGFTLAGSNLFVLSD